MVRVARGTATAKRRTYSLKFKLDIIREYEAGVTGQGFTALSKKFGLSRSVIRGWWSQREALKASLKDDDILTRKSRRLAGGGRKAFHAEMEERLHAWVLERNAKGLRVKDIYMSKMALNILQQLTEEGQISEVESFKASTGWLDRYVNIYILHFIRFIY
jgi:transposase-like protein